jgi:hypothetical protein
VDVDKIILIKEEEVPIKKGGYHHFDLKKK